MEQLCSKTTRQKWRNHEYYIVLYFCTIQNWKNSFITQCHGYITKCYAKVFTILFLFPIKYVSLYLLICDKNHVPKLLIHSYPQTDIPAYTNM